MSPSRFAVVLSSAVAAGALLASAVAPAGAVVPTAQAAFPSAGPLPADALAGGAGAGSGITSSARRPTPGASTHRITLITGDVAELTITQDGKRSARLVDGGNYYLGDFKNELTLVPIAAYPLLTEGRLDRRLFNLTELVAQGYDDAATADLPLLLSAPAAVKAPEAPAAATKRLTLASVGSTAVTVQKNRAKDFWNGIKGSNIRSAVGKIWLDGRTHATLDRSTKQIGAPTAWKSGYDGKGVKVAVLDTGYDTQHPDLRRQVAGSQSFIPDQGVQDGHGHGTHTASIVAGLGTASGGKRKGVAPGAQLLIGKVLDDSGSGLDSEAIAGMEWAVQQGAKVISMSLGGQPSDGTDPMSEAVDRLSATSDALFVIAAGNAGAEETVGTPGAAAAALTVGAVDRDDKLASFSSRGPRLGDGALKPEVTGPGVEIAAARAAGTEQGRELGEYYTTMSGTSMATPHVAGAAAILAQRHPEWTGEQLKAALASNAVPSAGATPVQQGLGRVDIPKALDTQVLPDSANLFFGDLSWTGSTAPAPVSRKIAYSNKSARAVTLELGVDAVSPGGVHAAVKVSPAKLAIAPGATASATVTVDLAKTKPAKYSGRLVARGGGSSYATGLGFAAGGRLNQVTVKAIDRDGKPAAPSSYSASGVQLWNLDTGDVQAIIFDETGGRTLDVPTGRYSVMAFVMGGDEIGWTNSVVLLGDPEATVSRDRTFVFDARKANKVTVKTPQRADAQSVGIAWHRKVGGRDAVSGWGFGKEVADGIYVQNFGKPADGSFQVVQRWDLAQPTMTVDVTGPGGLRLPTPDGGSYQTVYVGNEKLPLVNGGDGSPAELAEVKGRVALIRWRDNDQTAGQVQAAKDAGAKAVFLYNEQPGFWSDGAEVGLPVYLLRQPEGRLLINLLKQREVVLQLNGLRDSTYRYDLAVGPQVVNGPLTYDFARLRPAAVTTKYLRNDAWFLHLDQRMAHLPGLSTALTATRTVTGPVTRTDYLASDVPGITWDEKTSAGEWNESGFEYSLARSYRPGEKVTREWWSPLARPAIPVATGSEADGLPAARFENALRVAIPQYANGDRSVYGWVDSWGDSTSLTLSSNGKVLGSKNWSVAQFPVPARTAWYDLTLDVRRAEDSWAKTSTATHTTWHFLSAPTRTRAVLPLVQVDYQRTGNTLELKAGYQPGVRGLNLFRTTAEVSYDAGKTWRRLTVVPHGAARGTVRLPDAKGELTLRVTARDLLGNSVTQTIEKAWAAK